MLLLRAACCRPVRLLASASSSSHLSSSSVRRMSVMYTARAHTVGGRNGSSKSDDGKLAVSLSVPKEMGGKGGDGTNPEQLFASGYAACFLGAMGVAAKQLKLSLPADAAIDSAVSLIKGAGGELGLSVQMDVRGSGLSKAELQRVVDTAHGICPYSRATNNNVPVKFNVHTS